MKELRGWQLTAAVSITCGVGFALFGYDQSVAGGIISGPQFKQQFNNPSQTMVGFITSSYHLGCTFGAFATIFIGNHGRKKCIMAGSAIMIIGTILQTASFERIQIIVGRVVTGLGNGMNTTAIPMWQAEMLPAHSRGRYLNIQASLIIFGLALSNWVSFGVSTVNSSIQWRFPLAVQAIFAIYVVATLPFLPESPRFLIAQGRVLDGADIIARLQDKPTTDPAVVKEVHEIVETLTDECNLGQLGWKELFSPQNSGDLKRFILGIGPHLIAQWAGINTLSAYFPVVLQTVLGLPHRLSLIIAGTAATQYAISSIFPIFYIDRVGRRPAMIYGCLGCGLCMAGIAGGVKADNKVGGAFAIAFMFLFDDIFALGIHAVSWMYASEVNSIRTRNKGVAIAVMLTWLSNFVVVMITPIGLANLNYKFYIIWAVFGVAFMIICYLFYPETARKSLEEMDSLFMKKAEKEAMNNEDMRVDGESVRKDDSVNDA